MEAVTFEEPLWTPAIDLRAVDATQMQDPETIDEPGREASFFQQIVNSSHAGVVKRALVRFLLYADHGCVSGPGRVLALSFLDETEELSKLPPRELLARDEDGKTLVHYAVLGCAGKTVARFSQQLANMVDNTGRTALVLAILQCNKEAALALAEAEHGCKAGGLAPLWYLIWNDEQPSWYQGLARQLLCYGDQLCGGMTAEMASVYLGRLDLLSRCTPDQLDAADSAGRTLLHYAVQGNQQRIIRKLRQRLGRRTDRHGQTALVMRPGNGRQLVGTSSGIQASLGITALIASGFDENSGIWRRLRTTEAAMQDGRFRSYSAFFASHSRLPAAVLARADKTLGWLRSGESVLEIDSAQNACLAQTQAQTRANPLALKQIQLAKKQLARFETSGQLEYTADPRDPSEDTGDERTPPASRVPLGKDWVGGAIQHENRLNRAILSEAARLCDTAPRCRRSYSRGQRIIRRLNLKTALFDAALQQACESVQRYVLSDWL